jgi:hypothetical protein
MLEETEFFGRQHNLLPINGDFMPGWIELQHPISIGADVPILSPFEPPKQRFDSGHKRSRAEWFADVVIGSKLKPDKESAAYVNRLFTCP